MKLICIILVFFFHIIDLKGQQAYTAYIFVAEECPVCNYLGKTFRNLSADYADAVKFVAVFPQRRSNYKTASVFKKKYELTQFTIEIDKDQVITSRYNAKVTPEVVLVNNKNKILYRGRINDAYAAPGRMRHGRVTQDLEKAIELILRERNVPKPWPEPIGCYITRR